MSLNKTTGTTEVEETESKENQGPLIVYATCAPADIRYPPDISLLNEARENAESFIDFLYNSYMQLFDKKPRDYRQVA